MKWLKLASAVFLGGAGATVNRLPIMYPGIDTDLTPIFFWGGIIVAFPAGIYIVYVVTFYLIDKIFKKPIISNEQDNKLPLETIDREITLKEAATQAYEQTRLYDSFGEDASGLERLKYHAYGIIDKVPLYGEKPPSRIPELIPSSKIPGYTFNDGLDAFYPNGHGVQHVHWMNIKLKQSDLNKMIRTSAKFDSKTKKIIYPGLD